MKKLIILILILGAVLLTLVGCDMRQADRVSYNISQEADNFNVARQLTVINCRTDTVVFQMRGNFSINVDGDGDLNVIGEDNDGTYYKHFIRLSRDISYVVEDIDRTLVNKYKYEINFNPNMIIPLKPVIID